MIYTSYFGKLKKLPKNVTPVAICGGIPEWYHGLWYKKLAPKWQFFNIWKQTHDNDYYIRCYAEQVTGKLTAEKVAFDLQMLLPLETRAEMQAPVCYDKDHHIALICYEKPGQFCHRALVAAWLNKNGIECKEWEESDNVQSVEEENQC